MVNIWMDNKIGGEEMKKKMINGELDGTVNTWWERLTKEEQNVLITMLFNMNGEDFREFDVKIGSNDEYIATGE